MLTSSRKQLSWLLVAKYSSLTIAFLTLRLFAVEVIFACSVNDILSYFSYSDYHKEGESIEDVHVDLL